MAIIEMSKLRLLGLTNNREEILNALQKTGLVEVVETAEIEDTVIFSCDKEKEEVSSKYTRANKCVDFFTNTLKSCEKEIFYPREAKEYLNNFFVSYDEFISIEKKENEVLNTIEIIENYSKTLSDCRSEIVKLNNLRLQLNTYVGANTKFSDYKDTKTSFVFLGAIKSENLSLLKKYLNDYKFTEISVLKESEICVITIVSFFEEAQGVIKKLNELGFSRCVFNYDMTAEEKISEIEKDIFNIESKIAEVNKSICQLYSELKYLKVYADYYKFRLEKAFDSEKFRGTDKTFILDGYVPKESTETVSQAVNKITEAVFIEFSEPTEDDIPPTLLRNNSVIKQTEFVTNMYSVPNYREVDPSRVVFFFFMLFMGVIMADIGYGLLMICFGLLLAKRIKVDNGSRRLWYIVTIGGIFSIIFGVIFNSFFGVGLLPFTLLKSPIPDSNGNLDMNNLMVILLGCLGLGVIQIAVGYFYKALNCFKQKRFLDGIFEGVIWVIFFIGFVLAAFKFLLNFLIPDISLPTAIDKFFTVMQTPGLIIVIASIVIAALSAGRHEKGFGKFSKGFGAVYGLINIMSDILSYARLFGLMLSGMIIASTFNDMGLGIISGGGVGFALGPIIIIIGHVFNIAMNVLGAYIHDSRLQYIEFFSKFYTGEGRAFTPLGSQFDYIYLKK